MFTSEFFYYSYVTDSYISSFRIVVAYQSETNLLGCCGVEMSGECACKCNFWMAAALNVATNATFVWLME